MTTKKCVICGSVFETFGLKRWGSRISTRKSKRPRNSKTCGKKCSKELTKITRRNTSKRKKSKIK